MAQRTIVILGGGIAGIVTARDLRKHLGSQHRIILVDRNTYHTFQPSYFWMVVGWRTPAAITKPFAALEKYGIEFFHGDVQEINHDQKRILTDQGSISFDYLVIALGAENDRLLSDAPHADIHSFYSFENAVELSKIIPTFTGGIISIVVPHPDYKYPLAPFDAAFLLSSFFTKRGIENVRIKIYTAQADSLSFTNAQHNNHLRSLIDQHHIELFNNHRYSSFDSSNRVVQFNDSITARYDLLISVPQQIPSPIIRRSSLANDSGWITVNKKTLQTSFPGIWAIGDNVRIPLANGAVLPKAGVFANNQAEVTAFNIAHEILGYSQRKEFSGYGFFFIETGNGRASYLHGNFFTEPEPSLSWIEPNVTLHWGKVVIEKYWLWRWL